MHPENSSDYADVLGVNVSAVNLDLAVELADQWIAARNPGYICVTGVHGVMEAQEDPEFLPNPESRIYQYSRRNADVVGWPSSGLSADGPRLWAGLHGGDVPAFGRARLSQFFLRRQARRGGTAERNTAEEISRACRWSEHIRPHSETSLRKRKTKCLAQVRAIEAAHPVGRTEHSEAGTIHGAICRSPCRCRLLVGVGAAFDYHTGQIRDCSDWIKRAGLQWLHRLMQDPRRLWRRYLRNNPAFLWHIAWQISGLRRYPR